MPFYAYKFLKKEITNIKQKVLLLGVSYRSDVGDTRYTPVESFYNHLKKDGAKVKLHDPFVKYWEEVNTYVEESFNKVFESKYDIIVITTAQIKV